jgi:hypothetical protein
VHSRGSELRKSIVAPVSRRSVVVSQRGSVVGSLRGSISRIERKVGKPVKRTISLTKVIHPGRVKSVKRLNDPKESLKTSMVVDTSRQRIKKIIRTGSAKPKHIKLSQSLMQNSNKNHVTSVKRIVNNKQPRVI